MSEAELIFTALAELSTRQIAESTDASGMTENKTAAKTGGSIAKKARLELEEKTRKKLSLMKTTYLLPYQQLKKIEKRTKSITQSSDLSLSRRRFHINNNSAKAQHILPLKGTSSLDNGIDCHSGVLWYFLPFA